MGSRKEQQNLKDARTYFNYDLTSKKNNSGERFDAESFAIGMRWFSKGRSLEMAPSNLKNNISFIYGFNRAKRMKLIDNILTDERQLYELGKEYCLNGIRFDAVPDKYKENKCLYG